MCGAAIAARAATLEPPDVEEGGAFGQSVSAIRDLNGDGFDEILVGAPNEAIGGNADAGSAHLFDGNSDPAFLIRTFTSPNAEAAGGFGYSVSNVPDTNNDGVEDILVGAPFEGVTGFLNHGRAYLFSGADGALLHTLNPPSIQLEGRFGFAVKGLPDVNGDDFGDLLIGAPQESSVDPDAFFAGRAHVFSGQTGQLIYTLQSPNPDGTGGFGFAVTCAGDANGDGIGELFVGAPFEEDDDAGDAINTGRAYVFSGADGAFLKEFRASPAARSNDEQLNFGWSLAFQPDAAVAGGGVFYIGAPGSGDDDESSIANHGTVFHRQINSDNGGPSVIQTTQPATDGFFGAALALLPDARGPGGAYLLIGEPGGLGLSSSKSGAAYLFEGGFPVVRLISPDPRTGGEFGRAVAAIRDINGDGWSDAIVGASFEDFEISPGVNVNAGRAYTHDSVRGQSSQPAALYPGGASVEYLDTRGETGIQASIGIAANGRPRILYQSRDFPASPLKTLISDNLLWQPDTIDPVRVFYCSLGVEPSGKPHVCYFDDDTAEQKLYYATTDFTVGNWMIELVPVPDQAPAFTSINHGDRNSLALDRDGLPHLAFREEVNGPNGIVHRLIYTRKFAAGDWLAPEVVGAMTNRNVDRPGIDNGADLQLNTRPLLALALDESGAEPEPAILYLDDSTDLRIAQRDGSSGNWQSAPVEHGSLSGSAFALDDPSVFDLSLDSAGNAHVVYKRKLEAQTDEPFEAFLFYQKEPFGATVADVIDVNNAGHAAIAILDNVIYVAYEGIPPGAVHKGETPQGPLKLAVKNVSGGQWQVQTLSADPDLVRQQGGVSLAVEDTAADPKKLHVACLGRYNDLLYLSTGIGNAADGGWRTYPVTFAEIFGDDSLAVHDRRPYIAYTQTLTSTGLEYARWTGGAPDPWSRPQIAPLTDTVNAEISLEITDAGLAGVSYHDPAMNFLKYAQGAVTTDFFPSILWNLFEDANTATITGRYNSLVFNNGVPTIASRFSAGSLMGEGMLMSRRNGVNDWLNAPNTLSPANAFSYGDVSAVAISDGRVAVSYFHSDNSTLRLALWDGEAWISDVLIDGDENFVGFNNSLAVGSDPENPGVPNDRLCIAYTDLSANDIKYAFQTQPGGAFTIMPVVFDAPNVSSLELELLYGAPQLPRVAYTAEFPGQALLAFSNDATETAPTWQLSQIDDGSNGSCSRISLELDDKIRVSYLRSEAQLVYVEQASASAPHAIVSPPVLYNPLSACLPLPITPPLRETSTPPAPQGPVNPGDLDDLEIYALLRTKFLTTGGGQFYIELYNQHVGEMGALALSDLELLNDAYLANQNFHPGLARLVLALDDPTTISQKMIEDIRDVWLRLEVAGSPALSGAIGDELFRYNNLDDFVGLTFEEWFALISNQGGAPLGGTIVVNVQPSSATWSFTAGDSSTFNGMGSITRTNVAPGVVRLTWNDLPGFITPSPNPEQQNLTAGGTVTFTGIYQPEAGGDILAYLLGVTSDPAGLDRNGDLVVDVADLVRVVLGN